MSRPEGACAGGLVYQPVLLCAKSREEEGLGGGVGGDAGGAEDQTALPSDEYEEGEHAVPEEEDEVSGAETFVGYGGQGYLEMWCACLCGNGDATSI